MRKLKTNIFLDPWTTTLGKCLFRPNVGRIMFRNGDMSFPHSLHVQDVQARGYWPAGSQLF
eukprot:1997435-Ditylum_brightwellii.AAC.1